MTYHLKSINPDCGGTHIIPGEVEKEIERLKVELESVKKVQVVTDHSWRELTLRAQAAEDVANYWAQRADWSYGTGKDVKGDIEKRLRELKGENK